MRSTGFLRTRDMRGCHNNRDITMGCHNEASACWGVPNHLQLPERTPCFDMRDTDRRQRGRQKRGKGDIFGETKMGRGGGGWQSWKDEERERLKGQRAVIRMWWPVSCMCVCARASVCARVQDFELMRISDERRGSSWPACKWHQTHTRACTQGKPRNYMYTHTHTYAQTLSV